MENEKYQVKVERNLFIPLRDGATLAADLYRPDADGAFPALLSFYPYHKDDLIGAANEFPRRYFAARGYAREESPPSRQTIEKTSPNRLRLAFSTGKLQTGDTRSAILQQEMARTSEQTRSPATTLPHSRDTGIQD